ncbi:mechanosensitive ion channel family protein [Trinickia terrae]|uniref:Mechanosensitive ion channel family protein n=1 Tax=Trinickia terrae TaxID=2571161 RepID=A0A4V5PIB4_9BURK|nr:mechanosensitive ion channel family protein [Trinickia terrae]TKC86720.1 mechanosensitive ion channel family protein [Trinickia terrae]
MKASRERRIAGGGAYRAALPVVRTATLFIAWVLPSFFRRFFSALPALVSSTRGGVFARATHHAARCAWLVAVLAAALAAPLAQAITVAAGPPSLQSFINAVANPASAPSSASSAAGASAAEAASAPSPASQAEIARSLDNVIVTLDNDRQRTALVAQLKKLRDATRNLSPAAASGAQAAQQTPGLLGAIASGITSIEAQVRHGDTPLRYWASRLSAAGLDLYAIATGQGANSPGHVLLDLCAMLVAWGACASALVYLQRRLHARYRIDAGLQPNPSTSELMIFALRRVSPWVIAFVVVLSLSHSLADSLGRTLAMVIAYAIVAGAVFSAICLIMFSLFGSGHRRVAVRVLLQHARRLLFAMGICGALGDAAVNYQVASQLGNNLASLISTAANMAAAVLTGYFALAFRRPVAHLIRNRGYEKRVRRKAATEAFDVLASLWQLPMLLLVGASVVATLAGLDSSENVLQISVVTALMLVLAFFLCAVVMRMTRAAEAPARRRRSAYVTRLLRFVGTLITLFIWLAFLEFASRLWGFSLAEMVEESVTARGIAHAVTAILMTVFIAWLVWIAIDTAILEALNPSGPRSKSRAPGTRTRTMLPLVRNAVLVTILTVAAIVTAANLGINVTPLLAGAGVIGLAVGFGAQSLVSDLITGLFIIIEDTISVGDWIDIDGGHAGTVEHLTIRTVRLRDGQGAIHAIPFSQIKIVKNLSRDFAYAVFEVRVPFSADVEHVTRLIREAGSELMADFRYRREMLGPVEVWGLDRFEQNWMIVKGQIKTRPLQQWSVARAFNLRVKRKLDQAGIDIPVPQMQVYKAEREAPGEYAAAREKKDKGARAARDAAHEPRPAPPATGQTAPVMPQIPTTETSGKV